MGAAAILRYLAIPLRMAPLLLIGTFSVLLVVAVKAGLFGIPLGLILLSWFSKYSFVLMDQLAEGVAEPPVLSIEMVNPLTRAAPDGHAADHARFVLSCDAASYWIGKRARSCSRSQSARSCRPSSPCRARPAWSCNR